MAEDLRVGRSLVIPRSELNVRFTTSGGPGGQHANKTATRVELSWNVEDSVVLGPRQRSLIKTNLRRRIDAAGNLRVIADDRRSQTMNRREAERRLVDLVARALRPRKGRVGTAPTRGSIEKRLQSKRKRSEVKRLRRDPQSD